MDPFFKNLGESVYAQWKKENFDLTLFPEIARKELEKSSPSNNVDLQDLIHGFLLNDEQPFQSSSGFGQPELILYDNPKFYIQALFWLDGTTDIHQHEFSGAFHVMAGSSIHATYDFEKARSITAHFRLGDLKLMHVSQLETGSTVPIISGKNTIHSLFHLEAPSVTIVIRTHSDPGTGPQFTYLPPHIAIDPVQQDGLTTRRKQLLDVLEQTEAPDYSDLVAEMLGELDFERGFFILQNCIGHLRNLGTWEQVWGVFARKHGRLAIPVKSTLEEIIRRDALTAMRATVEDVEHRFFLALLLNLERREDIVRLVAKQYSGDPLATILSWAEELTQLTESGTWILDAGFSEELGIMEEEQSVIFLSALSHFITGGKASAELKKLSTVDLALLRETFTRSSWRTLLLPRQGKSAPFKGAGKLRNSPGRKQSAKRSG
jgi:hypothetical protein